MQPQSTSERSGQKARQGKCGSALVQQMAVFEQASSSIDECPAAARAALVYSPSPLNPFPCILLSATIACRCCLSLPLFCNHSPHQTQNPFPSRPPLTLPIVPTACLCPQAWQQQAGCTCMYLALLTAAWHSFLLHSRALCRPCTVSNSPCLLLSEPFPPGPSYTVVCQLS